MKILHTGDWHIGNFNGPEVNGENVRFLDICKCLDELVAASEIEEPDFIIIAGDVFHQARVWSDRGLKESRTAIHYIRIMEKIAPVIILRGTPNHDSEQQFRMLESAFAGDEDVHIFTEPGVKTIHGYKGQEIDVAALPGFDRGYFRAKNPGMDNEDENAVFTAALEKLILGMRAQCASDHPCVLVGHYTITGCNTESGQTQLFAKYEPVVDPLTLRAADFDLTCFGHIHRPQMLDGCNNTFYCGAISALNFNDEGQERGFYIHELPARKRKFYKLPTREFLTVRLQDEDIAAINGGEDLTWLSDAKDKIVRILYNCTDEHNKALNKTAFERRLYELGAFWVQEITPENITVTVSKNGLNGEDGPEENLTAFLQEAGYEEADAGRIMDRAKPIIAEATQATMKRHVSGTLMPVEIKVHNYRNYRDESFNFNDVSFCTINGVNGAGKSSLFMDAMLDALFEETREGDITGWISNAPDAKSGSIEFTFRLGERLYRVTRTRMKSGKATLNLSEEVDGEWVNRSEEKMRDTQAAIENAIGMDSLTLKSTGLIMQDQYGLFLTADKEARMSILGNILGLGAYEDMEDIASNRLTDTNRTVKALMDRAGEAESRADNAAALKAELKTAEETAEQLKKKRAGETRNAELLKGFLKEIEETENRVIKLNGRIASIETKLVEAGAARTSQFAIASAAEDTLNRRDEIMEGVRRRNELLAHEKELIAKFSSLEAAKGRNDQNLKMLQTETGKLRALAPRIEGTRAKLEERRAVIAQSAEREEAYKKCLWWKEEVARLAEQREEYLKSFQEFNRAGAVLESLKHRAKLLEDSKCPIAAEADCVFLKDAIDAQSKMADAQREYDACREAVPKDFDPNALANAQREADGLIAAERAYREVEAARKDAGWYEDNLRTLEAEEAETQRRIDELKKAVSDDKANLAEYDRTSHELGQVKSELARLREYVEEEKNLSAAEARHGAAVSRLAELAHEIDEYHEELAQLRLERQAEMEKCVGSKELRAEIKEAEERISAIDRELEEAQRRRGAVSEALERACEQAEIAKELRGQIEGLGIEAADLETLKRAFSRDGIPHNIVRSIIPIFEATATNILGQMSGGHMSVEFVMEKTLKSNSKKEVTALDIVINDSVTGRLPYMSRSGGERVKAALAVILALAEIKSTKAGVQLGFLFIDEPPFLDAQGVTAYCDALEAIQRRYSELKVMAITHDPAMKSRFPQSVDVIKTENGSKVVID